MPKCKPKFLPKKSLFSYDFGKEWPGPSTFKEKMAIEQVKNHKEYYIKDSKVYYKKDGKYTWDCAGFVDELCKKEMKKRMEFE